MTVPESVTSAEAMATVPSASAAAKIAMYERIPTSPGPWRSREMYTVVPPPGLLVSQMFPP